MADRGKQFLFSKDCGFIDKNDGESYKYSDGSGYYHGEDGSEGYIYSDGSGYYHGADGSEGYIYSDGSAYYRGADGTDAYKYSDGSGYYRGADGSDGYIYEDGSGYYTDANGDREDFDSPPDDSDDDDDQDEYGYSSSSSGFSFSETVGSAAGSLMYLMWAKEERERQIRSEKRKEFCKKHWKAIAISSWIFFCIILIILIINYNKKLTPIGYDADDLIGRNYTEVVKLLEDEGFTRIKLEEEKTLNYKDIEKENLVYSIKAGMEKEFDDDDEFAYDEKIVITYRTLELLTVPLSSKEAKGMNYKDVGEEFKDAGFVNIEFDIEYDIVTGWLTEVGEVEKVTIEDKKIKKDAEYRADTTIIIKYHAKKKDKPK